MSIGLPEILIVLLILLVIFGGRRIPELGRALGAGFRNLRDQVGRGSADEVESGQGAPPPSSSEPVEDEEAAKRP